MQPLILLATLAVATTSARGYHHDAYPAGSDYRYHGPPAPLAHDGRVVDTPEVAHAKAAHLAAHASEAVKTASRHGGYVADDDAYERVYAADHGDYRDAYHGPPAPLAHDGRVLDTPEVAHAKAAHFAAYAEELSKTGAHHHPAAHGYPHW